MYLNLKKKQVTGLWRELLVPSCFLSIIVGFLLRNEANQSFTACFEDMLIYA
jgi:hypothetical protein